MAPPSNAQACPYCGAPVGELQKRCPGCDALFLYGLVAPPQSDPRLQDRVAAILAAVPGGPGRLEARRRVREGLPLIVGLSRPRTEELQGRLVDLGLVPRIGPAPRGTAPLEPEPSHRGLARRVALALAIPVLAFLLFRLLEPDPPPPEPTTGAGEAGGEAPAQADAPPVQLGAAIERERHGHMWLVVTVRVRSEGPPPEADVVLRIRDGTGTVMWTGSVSTHRARDLRIRAGDADQVVRTVHGRLSLGNVFLKPGDEITVEAGWQGLASARTPLEVPPPIPRRR